MNKWVLMGVLMVGLTSTVYANSSLNLSIPNGPMNYQSDRIRADGTECSMAIGSATNVEFGVVGVLGQDDPYNTSITTDPSDEFRRDVGVYARINIPIGAPKKRLDCNLLYKIELERKRMEIMKLKRELYNLQQMKFEN